MKRRTLLAGLAGAPAVLSLPVRAQALVKIAFGFSAVTDFSTVFVATDEGLFSKRGLDVEPRFIPLNPTIIPGIESGSLQMGGPTPLGYLQAVDGGLDHVVLAGGGSFSKKYTEIALVARAGTSIRSAADCVGKKIGVPGLGALLHVTFRQWLKLAGVDYSKVSFIEAPFPQHGDLIRGGSLDAVVTAGPFLARILEAGTGYVSSYYTTFLPEGYPTIVHTARRDWVQKNPAVPKAFREALVEATAWMAKPANDARMREIVAKYLKTPPAIAAKMQIGPPLPVVTVPHLKWWVDMMREQQMLKGNPALDTLIAKG